MTQHRVHVYGDNINTDLIFAGKYTYTLREKADIARHALEDLDATFVDRVVPGDVIVAGANWGNGSSREQGVTCLKWNGISAIVAASFGGLYMRNCINQGIHPIICPQLHTVVRTGDSIDIDYENGLIRASGNAYPIPPVSPSVRAILEAGGLIPMLARRFQMEAHS